MFLQTLLNHSVVIDMLALMIMCTSGQQEAEVASLRSWSKSLTDHTYFINELCLFWVHTGTRSSGLKSQTQMNHITDRLHRWRLKCGTNIMNQLQFFCSASNWFSSWLYLILTDFLLFFLEQIIAVFFCSFLTLSTEDEILWCFKGLDSKHPTILYLPSPLLHLHLFLILPPEP